MQENNSIRALYFLLFCPILEFEYTHMYISFGCRPWKYFLRGNTRVRLQVGPKCLWHLCGLAVASLLNQELLAWPAAEDEPLCDSFVSGLETFPVSLLANHMTAAICKQFPLGIVSYSWNWTGFQEVETTDNEQTEDVTQKCFFLSRPFKEHICISGMPEISTPKNGILGRPGLVVTRVDPLS